MYRYTINEHPFKDDPPDQDLRLDPLPGGAQDRRLGIHWDPGTAVDTFASVKVIVFPEFSALRSTNL